jgi:hypothetical protein
VSQCSETGREPPMNLVTRVDGTERLLAGIRLDTTGSTVRGVFKSANYCVTRIPLQIQEGERRLELVEGWGLLWRGECFISAYNSMLAQERVFRKLGTQIQFGLHCEGPQDAARQKAP